MNRYYKNGDKIKFKAKYTAYLNNYKSHLKADKGSKGMILEINHANYKILLESGRSINIPKDTIDNYIVFDASPTKKLTLKELISKDVKKLPKKKQNFKKAGISLRNLAKQLENGTGSVKLIEKNLLSLKALIKEQEDE